MLVLQVAKQDLARLHADRARSQILKPRPCPPWAVHTEQEIHVRRNNRITENLSQEEQNELGRERTTMWAFATALGCTPPPAAAAPATPPQTAVPAQQPAAPQPLPQPHAAAPVPVQEPVPAQGHAPGAQAQAMNALMASLLNGAPPGLGAPGGLTGLSMEHLGLLGLGGMAPSQLGLTNALLQQQQQQQQKQLAAALMAAATVQQPQAPTQAQMATYMAAAAAAAAAGCDAPGALGAKAQPQQPAAGERLPSQVWVCLRSCLGAQAVTWTLDLHRCMTSF